MNRIIHYHIWPRDLHFHEKIPEIFEFARKRSLEPHRERFSLQINKFEEVECDTLEEMLEIIKRTPPFISFIFNVEFIKPRKEGVAYLGPIYDLRVYIYHHGHIIRVEIGSHDIDLVSSAHTFIKDTFQFRNPEVPLPDARRAIYPHPTVFVGRHFDLSGNESFSELYKFLIVLGFDVRQGEEYASEPIPKKVAERIDGQDLYICLVTGVREHDWLIGEAAYAKGRGKHIILLLEESATFNPTILGQDLEQIRFPPSHIEKSFIPLMEEFRSIGVQGI